MTSHKNNSDSQVDTLQTTLIPKCLGKSTTATQDAATMAEEETIRHSLPGPGQPGFTPSERCSGYTFALRLFSDMRWYQIDPSVISYCALSNARQTCREDVCMYIHTCKRGATARRRQTVRAQEKTARRQRAPAPKKLVHVCVYVRSGTHAGETSSEVPDVWVAASDEALAIQAGMGHEGREFFASQPASKELACEPPGIYIALALASPLYDHPRHLKAKRIGHVLTAAQNALHMYFS